MKCRSCQIEVEASATFCPQCGARLSDDATQKAEAEAAANIPLPPSDSSPGKQKFKESVAARANSGEVVEDEIWSGRYSKMAMIGWWGAAGVATLAAVVAGILWARTTGAWGALAGVLVLAWLSLVGLYYYRRYSVHYHLTSQRFVHETGILWRRTDRIELIDIDDVTVRQGPIERLFEIGTIHLSSSDRTDPEMDLPGIENVREVASKIDDLRRKERRRRGLHIEAI